jgi:hypothetical protein
VKQLIDYYNQQINIYNKKFNKTKSKTRKKEYRIIMEYFRKEIESTIEKQQGFEMRYIRTIANIK